MDYTEIKSRIGDFPTYRRSPRLILEPPTEKVEIKKPAGKAGIGKSSLVQIIVTPLAMLAVTVGMGLLLKRGLYMMMGVAGTLVTSIFSVYRYVSEKKECKEKNIKREDIYTQYLLDTRKKIFGLRNKEKECYSYISPKINDVVTMVNNYSSRIYEKVATDADFLTVTVGYCEGESSSSISYQYDELAVEKDELESDAKELADEYRNIKDIPVTVDLKKSHLGLVGSKEIIHEQLHILMAKVAFMQSYHDCQVILLIDPKDRKEFDYMKWYPHFNIEAIGTGGIIDNGSVADQVLLSMHKLLQQRDNERKEKNKDMIFSPYFLFIVDDKRLVIDHVIQEYLGKEEPLGFSVIYTSDMQENLPENVGTIVKYMDKNSATLVMNERKVLQKGFYTDTLSGENLEWMARNLSVLMHEQGLVMHLPENVSFYEMMKVTSPSQMMINERWQRAATNKSLAVPIGIRVTGEPLILNLHEKAHGPHGLIAGTTGSGKSEIIQTYILSLAVNYHPYDVAFLLIDYKGGGMAHLFKNLPHVLGTITNLDADESMRALVSIKSELSRRQRIFNDYEVNHINAYTALFKDGAAKEPLPHLFIISDEFAELKKEQPEFMTELVSTARLGRSLGIHLILATQKPSGVVTDQIWSNSRFKLALKVQDEADSKEIIKTADAAYIRNPGRAYLQVGNNEIYELFQSAYSGAMCRLDDIDEELIDNRIYIRNHLGQMELLNEDLSDESQDRKIGTQLDATVEYISSLYEKCECKPVRRPWLEPLGENIVSPYIDRAVSNNNYNNDTVELTVSLGVLDMPQKQSQEEYKYDFKTDGDLAIFGAAGYGKSTILTTMIVSMAFANKANLLNFYILDMGSGSLMLLKNIPHVADYMNPDDTEKIKRFRGFIEEELKERKKKFSHTGSLNFDMYNRRAEKKIPAIIIVIDNYDINKEVDEELDSFVTGLVRDGASMGIYVVLSASRPGVLRFGLSGVIKSKIALYMYDKSEIASAVGRTEFGIKDIRGRGLVKLDEPALLQVYTVADMINEEQYIKDIEGLVDTLRERNSDSKVSGIKVMPSDLTTSVLTGMLESEKVEKNLIPIGLECDTLDTAYIDLNNSIYLLSGGSGSGKTNLLKVIIRMFDSSSKLFVIDDKSQEMMGECNSSNVTYIGDKNEFWVMLDYLKSEIASRKEAFDAEKEKNPRIVAKQFYSQCPHVLLLCADIELLVSYISEAGEKAEGMLIEAQDYNISTVISCKNAMNRLSGDYARYIRNTPNGIVTGNFQNQSVFMGLSPRLGNDNTIGVGFICDKGKYIKIRIAKAE